MSITYILWAVSPIFGPFPVSGGRKAPLLHPFPGETDVAKQARKIIEYVIKGANGIGISPNMILKELR